MAVGAPAPGNPRPVILPTKRVNSLRTCPAPGPRTPRAHMPPPRPRHLAPPSPVPTRWGASSSGGRRDNPWRHDVTTPRHRDPLSVNPLPTPGGRRDGLVQVGVAARWHPLLRTNPGSRPVTRPDTPTLPHAPTGIPRPARGDRPSGTPLSPRSPGANPSLSIPCTPPGGVTQCQKLSRRPSRYKSYTRLGLCPTIAPAEARPFPPPVFFPPTGAAEGAALRQDGFVSSRST